MAEIFVISDTHFNHTNMLSFKDANDRLFRGDRFKDTSHMNETIIENWNRVVSPQDKIYHLGDVYMGQREEAVKILERLNGKKRLILGNHDTIYGNSILSRFFKKIYVWRVFKEFNMCLTHVPIHESSFRKVDYNVHGHIHEKQSPTKQHINVSCEAIDYTPVHIEEVIKKYGKS